MVMVAAMVTGDKTWDNILNHTIKTMLEKQHGFLIFTIFSECGGLTQIRLTLYYERLIKCSLAH